ncbi:MAG: endonuclease III [Candidatus Sungiibacteriota bacterium]|uniref:Endonuclease III n=1 Tax=Candidatus Sungiibacteriota bacterium TaxID=2750080 RepID=A0A7T5UQS6_9BACT|nr:MAG: endonuclease III [Candidatus Sungbacteria bacterium]
METNFKKESAERKKKRTQVVIRRLKKKYPDAKIILNFSSPWELLVAVILSAQCTDKKVNEVTARLFKKYRTPNDYVKSNSRELEKIIRPTGFYRAKARNILATAKIIKEKFNGKVPRTMAEMLTLKGVARKTANVVLGNAYGVVEGVAVDTHVRRLAQRLGLSATDDPVKIEQDLMALIPKKDWFKITYLLIDHGRAICTAKDPRCDLCPLNDRCPSAFQFPRFKKNKSPHLPTRY